MGPDEAFLEIRVDDSRSLGSCVSLMDGPGAHFLHPGREVGLEAQQIVAGMDEDIQAGFGQASLLQE